MKIIFKIAKTELQNIFYSPVAWFLATLFLVQCSIFFMPSLAQGAKWWDEMRKSDPTWNTFSSLTRVFFFDTDGIFSNALRNLYLFIPLLTMGILSREVNNGTIKLLYSSPIKLRDIILGKYLALIIYNFTLVAIIGLFIVTGAFSIKSIDYGLLMSAILGFYLLACTYAAIGLFMSSLTTYQIISGIATFTIFFILSRIGTLWQKYDFVRDLTWFLSITGRTEKMLKGLIVSKDVIYFIVVICMFLGFTLFKLKSVRESSAWTTKAGRYLAVILSGLLIGYISARPALTGYWDATAIKSNTIHPRSQEILKAFDEHDTLEVTLFANLFGERTGPGLPEGRNPYLTNLWEPFLRFKPDIQFKYVYYYYDDGSLNEGMLYKGYPGKTLKQIAGKYATAMDIDSSMFIGPDSIRKMIDPNSEDGKLFMQLRYKGRKVNLRTFNDPMFWPDESLIDDALKRLLYENSQKIYFLTGNLERSVHRTGEREYSVFSSAKEYRGSLINHSFDIDTLSLEDHDLPADMDLLVIGDPKTKLGELTMNKLRQYVNNGGNLLITGEPGKQAVLNPLLTQLGIALRPGTLVELSKNETPDKIIPYITSGGAYLAEEPNLFEIKERIKKKLPLLNSIMMPGATAISSTVGGPFTVRPIASTFNDKTWLKAGRLVIDSVPPVFTSSEGDIKELEFATAVQLTRRIVGKEQRIIVTGDADFTSNMRLATNIFSQAFYSWFSYAKYPQYLPNVYIPKDGKLIISGITSKRLNIIYTWILPALLILTGTILLIRRKRK